MILALSLTIAILSGAGARLLLSRDLFRVTAGAVLLSNAVILFLVAAGRAPEVAALDPLRDVETLVDPLMQALSLTGIVVTFGVAVLLLGLVVRVYLTHHTVRLETIADAEREELAEVRAEREDV